MPYKNAQNNIHNNQFYDKIPDDIPEDIAPECYQNRLSYADFLNNIENDCRKANFKQKDICRCLEDILCYQAWMCKCEAELFCKTSSRLSYELYKANNLCEVKQIVDTISCLFTASAVKGTSLAQVLRCYCGCPPPKHDCDCN